MARVVGYRAGDPGDGAERVDDLAKVGGCFPKSCRTRRLARPIFRAPVEVEHGTPGVLEEGVLEELDERGYLSRKRLQMGCEAAVCRTPFGARIVAGRGGLEEPQYAWDYTSVTQAHKALAQAEFKTDPKEGMVVDEFGSGFYPAAEPSDYLRRWMYTTDGQVQRF